MKKNINLFGRIKNTLLKNRKKEKLTDNRQGINEDKSTVIKNKVIEHTPDFDASFYTEANPDTALLDPYFHYWTYGRFEYRHYKKKKFIDSIKNKKIDEFKENIIIVTHDLSITGCPILSLNIAKHLKAKYNVFALPLQDGKLRNEFIETFDVVLESSSNLLDPEIIHKELDEFIKKSSFLFSYAIVNSIVSRLVLPAIAKNFIPSISLIHEFASYIFPKDAIRETVLWSNETIFSAQIVLDDNIKYCKELEGLDIKILPQGICKPIFVKKVDSYFIQDIKKSLKSYKNNSKTTVVLGCGSVHLRKGVDLFISSAAILKEKCAQLPFKFVWAGGGFDPLKDLSYSSYLEDQIMRYDIKDYLIFIGEIIDIDQIYEISDILFLSSRLDPLPNVAIESMSKGIPIICFDKSSGIAEILNGYDCGKYCVAPYLDVQKASELILNLIKNKSLYSFVSEQMAEIANEHFNMPRYVSRLNLLARKYITECIKENEEYIVLLESDCINTEFISSVGIRSFRDKEMSTLLFIKSWKKGIGLHKPYPGFHPGIYAEQKNIDCKHTNPLTHFIKAGSPEGLWNYQVFEINSNKDDAAINLDNLVALHIHCHDIHFFKNILYRLDSQNIPIDLFLTAHTEVDLDRIKKVSDAFDFNVVEIKQIPNNECKLYPLFTCFGEIFLERYIFFGHVYADLDGDRLSEESHRHAYMLDHLLGGRCHTARIILDKMYKTPQLGLVFPEDPCISEWAEDNRQLGLKIAQELNIQAELARHHNYPSAGMFWSRTQALKPMLTSNHFWKNTIENCTKQNYTSTDQALAHLLPYIVEKCGFECLQTYLP